MGFVALCHIYESITNALFVNRLWLATNCPDLEKDSYKLPSSTRNCLMS